LRPFLKNGNFYEGMKTFTNWVNSKAQQNTDAFLR